MGRRDTALHDQGFDLYLSRIRSGADDVYAAYRICEHSFLLRNFRDKRKIVRRAIKILVKADPYSLVTAIMPTLDDLRDADIEELCDGMSIDDPGAAAYLKGRLWYSARCPGSDKNQRRLAKALAWLEIVSERYRETGWYEMVSDCLQNLDYKRYRDHFQKLLARVDPEWQVSHLAQFLEEAVNHGDWASYRRYRAVWDALPKHAHMCSCHQHEVANLEGLRALQEDCVAEIPPLLEQAMDIHGCPHLNTGGVALKLVSILIDRKLHPDACRTYLTEARKFGHPERTEALWSRLVEGGTSA